MLQEDLDRLVIAVERRGMECGVAAGLMDRGLLVGFDVDDRKPGAFPHHGAKERLEHAA